ncbi:MAG: hypothetical protein K5765_08375 [Clostridia bacterium]|nr:hypothetical protein [Clostridia bacterium]
MKKSGLLFISLVIILCMFMAMFLIIGNIERAEAKNLTISDWGIEYFNKLDTGVYWFTEKNQKVPTKDAEIDKTKPTFIYAHGWKPNESMYREGFSLTGTTINALKDKKFPEYVYEPNYYNYYLDQGYNVGIFYWNQLADQGLELVSVVDRKIWSIGEGTETVEPSLRYKTYESEGATGVLTAVDDPTNPKIPVSVIYANDIIKYLGKDYEGKLYLAGHSMGGQLTCAVSQYLCTLYDKKEISASLVPVRAALIDPYFPVGSVVSGFVNCRDEYVKDMPVCYLAAQAVKDIADHGVLVEGYGTNYDMCFRFYESKGLGKMTTPSFVTDELKLETTKLLTENAAWIYLKGLGSKYGGFTPTHVMTIDYYFTTIYMNLKKSEEGYYIPQARLSDDELRKIIGMFFIQSYGSTQNTLYMNESKYTRVNPYVNEDGEFEPFSETDDTERIVGQIELYSGETELKSTTSTLKVVAVDENDKEYEGVINQAGYYYINYLPEGNYTVKVTVDNTTIVVEDVETSSLINVAEVKEAQARTSSANLDENNKIYRYMIIAAAILAVFMLVIVIASIVIKKDKKRHEWMK